MNKICFRCGKPIKDTFYVHTLSNEDAHIYCQSTGVQPSSDTKKTDAVNNYHEELTGEKW